MNKKDLIDVIVIAVLLSILIIFNCKLSADSARKDNKINELEQQINNDLSQSRINELEQQVEEQYYLIDSLRQEE